MKNIIIIGFGSIGQRHSQNLFRLGFDNIIVVEPNEEMWKPNKKITFFAQLPEKYLSEQKHLYAFFICTPTSTHKKIILQALPFCHALFVEKPLVHTFLDSREVRAALKERSVLTMVGCNYRFEEGLAKVKEILETKKIGEALSSKANFGYSLPLWRPKRDYRETYSARSDLGGGVVLDRIHEFDYLRWLFGDGRVVKAEVKKNSDLDIDCEDTADILMQFDHCPEVTLHLDYLSEEYICSCEIFCEKGRLSWRFNPSYVKIACESKDEEVLFFQEEVDVNQMYLDELRYFLDACEKNITPINGIEEACQTLELALKAKGIND